MKDVHFSVKVNKSAKQQVNVFQNCCNLKCLIVKLVNYFSGVRSYT